MLLSDNIFKNLSKRRNAIMGIAAISILIFHYTFFPIFEKETFLYSVEKFIKKNGNLGVDFFFLLSGFGLLYSIEKHSVKRFYYNRFKRLIIPYTVSVFVYCYAEGMTILDTLKGYIGYSFFFENIYATPWFVPAIAILYLLFPIYYKIFSKFKNKTLFTVCIVSVIWLLLSGVINLPIRTDFNGFLTRIPVFLVGVLFGYYSKYGYSNKDNIRRINLTILVVSCLLLVVSIYFLYLSKSENIVLPRLFTTYYLPAFFVTISGSLVYTYIFSINNIIVNTIDKTFNVVGKYSYEIYCIEDFAKAFIYFVDPYIGNVFIKDVILFIEILIMAYILNAINNIIIKKIEKILNV